MPTIDELYWENRYKQGKTGWDIGNVSEPLKVYIDQIEQKNLKILIPGCGNAYEAKYLLEQGFQNVNLIDVSETLVKKLEHELNYWINLGFCSVGKLNYFELTGNYDLILEQTFFCWILITHSWGWRPKPNWSGTRNRAWSN